MMLLFMYKIMEDSLKMIWHDALVVISGNYLGFVRSQQPIWRSAFYKFHLLEPDLQNSCNDMM